MSKHRIAFILLISTLLVIWFSHSALSQQAKLIARWPMDEGSGGVIGDAVSDNDGERVAGGDWVPAKFGTGIQFDKKTGQYIEVSKAPELEPDGPLTVIAWVNVNSSAGRQEIFCYGDAYVMHIDAGVFKAYIHDGGAFPRAPGKTPVKTDKWYFLAMTYDLKDLKLYVDGKLDGGSSLPGGIVYLGLPLRFGNNPAAPGQTWGISGILDEVEIWDQAMTEGQIMEAFESPLSFLAVSSKGKLAAIWGGLKLR